ncbi:hypothetical protein HanPI659440_Chr08g0284041 [Helianthus annuus]|nr:hypothetical protein HanPI659440_Chr08g0284041 [Helianthus annuus]
MLETVLWALGPSPQNPHYINGFTPKISHFHLKFLSLTLKSSQLSLSLETSPARIPADYRWSSGDWRLFRRIFRRPFFGQEYTFSTISDVPDRVVRCLDRDLRSISANFQEILFSGEIPTSDMVLARFQPSVFDENYIFGLLVTRRLHTKHFRLG